MRARPCRPDHLSVLNVMVCVMAMAGGGAGGVAAAGSLPGDTGDGRPAGVRGLERRAGAGGRLDMGSQGDRDWL
jgi:hypothetical protein